MLTSKGSAGFAGAGFVALAAIYAAMNVILVAGIVLILGVDRFVNLLRALLNVIGQRDIRALLATASFIQLRRRTGLRVWLALRVTIFRLC